MTVALLVLASALAACDSTATPGPTAGQVSPTVDASVLASPAPDPTPASTTAPTPPVPPIPPEPPVPTYEATVSPIDAELALRMSTSWRPGCPVPLEDLRHVALRHRTFEGGVADGELVVHAEVADGIVAVFRDLFDAGYPIRQMRLVDDFGADDGASMDADNTSAFNCRTVAGTTRWSEHAYGRAIDVNPVENPWVRGRSVDPEAGRAFADRPDAPGVIHPDDAVVRAFAAQGWQWGGYWSTPVDYQHFSVSGR